MSYEDIAGEKVIRDFPELEFRVVGEPHEYHVEYVIYEIVGETMDGKPMFHKADEICHPSPIETLEGAEVYFSGSVKWDGCSNWLLEDRSGGYRHFCRREALENIGKILAACWDMTKELCPKADEPLFPFRGQAASGEGPHSSQVRAEILRKQRVEGIR